MAITSHIKFIGVISMLFACGLVAASALLLTRVLNHYKSIKQPVQQYQYHGRTVHITNNFLSGQSLNRQYRATVVEYKYGLPAQHPNESTKTKIELSYPGIREEVDKVQSDQGKITFMDLLNARTNNRRNLINFNDDSPRTSSLNTKIINSSNTTKVAVNNLKPNILQLSRGRLENVGRKELPDFNGVPKCPSSSEFKVFVVLSSTGIVFGVFQIITALLSCFATKKMASGISSLLIIYNVSSCVVLTVVLGLTFVNGSCIRHEEERPEWLGFASVLSLDAAVLFILICYSAYILTNDFESTEHQIGSDKSHSEDEERDCNWGEK